MKNEKGNDRNFMASVLALIVSPLVAIFILLWLIPMAAGSVVEMGCSLPLSLKPIFMLSLFFRKNLIFILPLIILTLTVIISLGLLAKNKAIYSKLFDTISYTFLIFIIICGLEVLMIIWMIQQSGPVTHLG